MAEKASDYLIYDEAAGVYRENPEQAVRDEVEKHYWRHVMQVILKDWRLYLMLVPMLLVFLFWRYMPMYELLGSFKVDDVVKPVSEQFFKGFSNFKGLLAGSGTYSTLSTEFWRAMRNTFLLSFYGLCSVSRCPSFWRCSLTRSNPISCAADCRCSPTCPSSCPRLS